MRLNINNTAHKGQGDPASARLGVNGVLGERPILEHQCQPTAHQYGKHQQQTHATTGSAGISGGGVKSCHNRSASTIEWPCSGRKKAR